MEKLGKRNDGPRGFPRVEFKDAYDQACFLQSSSVIYDYDDAMERPGTSALWLGLKNTRAEVMARNAAQVGVATDTDIGWVKFPIPDQVMVWTQMHLNREQVAGLLPAPMSGLGAGIHPGGCRGGAACWIFSGNPVQQTSRDSAGQSLAGCHEPAGSVGGGLRATVSDGSAISKREVWSGGRHSAGGQCPSGDVVDDAAGAAPVLVSIGLDFQKAHSSWPSHGDAAGQRVAVSGIVGDGWAAR